MSRPKIYLAGPDIFLPNFQIEVAPYQRALCDEFGLEALIPLDNVGDISEGTPRVTGMRVFHGNIGQVRICDIIAANCNPFRGALMDDGTAGEITGGYMIGKISYGYMKHLWTYDLRVELHYPTQWVSSFGKFMDKDGFLVYDEFGRPINLMQGCAIESSGGRFVEGDLRACLAAIREDLDASVIQI